MNENKIREAFEQNPRYDFEKDASGYYVHAIVADAFVNFRDGYQAATRAAVPDGWKAVPFEPTPEMIKATGLEDDDVIADVNDLLTSAYREMLAAAPEVKP